MVHERGTDEALFAHGGADPSSPIRTCLSAPNAAPTTFRFHDTASHSANKGFVAPADSEPRELIQGRTVRRNEIVTQEARAQPTGVELIAVLVAVADTRPLAMTIGDGRALPSGPFEVGHRSLQSGLRAADRPSAWLCRAALHLRRFRSARRRGRRARFRSATSGSCARSAPRSRSRLGGLGTTISRGRTISQARRRSLPKRAYVGHPVKIEVEVETLAELEEAGGSNHRFASTTLGVAVDAVLQTPTHLSRSRSRRRLSSRSQPRIRAEQGPKRQIPPSPLIPSPESEPNRRLEFIKCESDPIFHVETHGRFLAVEPQGRIREAASDQAHFCCPSPR